MDWTHLVDLTPDDYSRKASIGIPFDSDPATSSLARSTVGVVGSCALGGDEVDGHGSRGGGHGVDCFGNEHCEGVPSAG
jgi:hypothetical protein